MLLSEAAPTSACLHSHIMQIMHTCTCTLAAAQESYSGLVPIPGTTDVSVVLNKFTGSHVKETNEIVILLREKITIAVWGCVVKFRRAGGHPHVGEGAGSDRPPTSPHGGMSEVCG